MRVFHFQVFARGLPDRTSPRSPAAPPPSVTAPGFRRPAIALAALASALVGLFLPGCGTAEGDAGPEALVTRELVLDDLGRPVPVAPSAHRVVSLLPSVTEIVLALGVGDRLVARTLHDRDARIQALPSLGGGMTPSLEALVHLRPDLVVAWADGAGRTVVEQIEAAGVRVYAAKSATVEDLLNHALDLGRLLDLEDRADSLVLVVERGLEDLAVRVSGADPPSVLYAVWHDPLITTGPGTFVDRVIEVAGGRNVFSEAGSGWPRVSLEEVVRRDPDVVVVTGHSDRAGAEPGWLRTRPGWRDLRAVREGRVLVVDPDLFSRPGPRVVEAARILATFLHPQRFAREREGT